MSKPEVRINIPQRGLNRDQYNLGESDYSTLLNGLFDGVDGGTFTLTNEMSNLLSSRFKAGFKVINATNDIYSNTTFFFLVNPLTGVGEFGQIRNLQQVQNIDDVPADCEGCVKKLDLAEPLENTIQTPLNTYDTLLTDECHIIAGEPEKGFQFSINSPIKKTVIKNEKCGKTIYFTDNNTAPRYIILDNLQQYKQTGRLTCGVDEAEPTCLDADKLLILKKYNLLNITPISIQLGGRLKLGVYEFVGAYCDQLGNEISEYTSITNPIQIFDRDNVTLTQNELSTPTNFSIKLEINNLDSRFTHYKIAVIQTTLDVVGVTKFFIEGIHTINDKTVIYGGEQNKQAIELSDLIKENLYIQRWEFLTESNNSLIGAGITVEKEINLQPVVNFLGTFLKWQTHIASEELYKDGVDDSLYLSINRDEVVPYSIRFLLEGGYKTALFPLINRNAKDSDLVEVSVTNRDRVSIESNLGDCNTTDRTKYWQYYNTATEDEDFCSSEEVSVIEVQEEVEKICIIQNVGIAPAATFTIDLTEEYTDLKTFIEDNLESCTTYTGCPDINQANVYPFCNYFNLDCYSDQNCLPIYDNCDLPLLYEEKIIIADIVNSVETKIEAEFPTEYGRLNPPKNCLIYEIDTTTGNPRRDTEFENNFMGCRNVVFDRDFTFSNTECAYSEGIVNATSLNATSQGYYHDYAGALTVTELQTAKTTIDAGIGWTDKIQKGALWFKASINKRTDFILEMSKLKSVVGADNVSRDASGNPVNQLRLTIYNKCNSTTPLYSTIVNTTIGTRMRFIKTDTSWTIQNEVGGVIPITTIVGDIIYIAIDTKIIEQEVPSVRPSNPIISCDDYTTKYRTAPASGCFSLVTRDIEYTRVDISYDAINLNKRQTYRANCTFEKPVVNACKAVPYKKGNFAYWESQEVYPDNPELYNSSILKIKPQDILAIERSQFEIEFTQGLDTDGNYIWKNDELGKPLNNYTCREIRHFKFPDNKVSPFMYERAQLPQSDSVIYPLGVTVNESLINSFLDIAVNNNLLTKEKRNQITGYELFRGDVNQDRSIVSSGLLFDVRKYTNNDTEQITYYPNYPYNDLGDDRLNYANGNRNAFIPHAYNGNQNDKFTYHSPETDYARPTLPTELSVQGYVFGQTDNGYFDEVKDHSKWVILTSKAKNLAGFLAGLEVATEVAVQLANAGENYRVAGGFVVSVNPTGVVLSIVAGALSAVSSVIVNYGRYRLDWIKAFRDLGQPENFAYYYHSSGKYNYMQTLQENGNTLRGLQSAKYLKEGNFSQVVDSTGEKININNIDREKSVFITMGGTNTIVYPEGYKNYDNNKFDINNSSIVVASEKNACSAGRSREIKSNIASPYVALKNYLPSQYGTINSIKWLSTGYRGDLKLPKTSCLSIFGGDTYISRHTLKRKMPIFIDNAFGLAPLTPFNYKFYSNIGKEPRFYVDYETITDFQRQSAIFPDIDYDLKLDCETRQTNYYRPPSKFYLYYYGVPNFLTETRINTWNRTAEPTLERNFFPNTGDTAEWTQEKNVSIRKPEFFFYNSTYSKAVTTTAYRTLSDTFNQSESDCRNDKPNGIMWSQPDNSENNYSDPYLNYKPLDFFEFDSKYGKLKDIRTIEREQILIRQENATSLFNAIDVAVDDGKRAESRNLASAFARRPMTYSETDLGYGGTQSSQSVSCEFGHFHADTKRGQVILIPPGGQGMEEISSIIQGKPSGMRNWFKDHLPFKILKSNITNINDLDVDNAINGVGVTMGYDSRFRRVFLTKKDYIPVNDPCLKFDKNIGFYTDCGEEEVTCPKGYTYNSSTEKCEKTVISQPLCPDGYTYDIMTQTCTLIEVTPANCECAVDVIATPITQTIEDGDTTNITLTSSTLGTTFTWTVIQSGVTGATNGSGNMITQSLFNSSEVNGTATYTITPHFEDCLGTPIDVIITVTPSLPIVFKLFATNNSAFSLLSIFSSKPTTVNWGDGVIETLPTGGQLFSHIYSAPYTGEILITTYKTSIGNMNIGQNTGNTRTIEVKTSELFKLKTLGVLIATRDDVTGNISQLPRTLTEMRIDENQLTGSVNDFPLVAQRISIKIGGTITGYNAGRTWSSNMKEVSILPEFGGLTSIQVDNLLKDLSMTTWQTAGKIDLRGINAPRTGASNTAITTLNGMGVVVNTN